MTLLNSTCSPFLAAAADYKIKPQGKSLCSSRHQQLDTYRGHATRPFVNIPMPHSYAEALLISEKERETQNHYHYSLSVSLFYISTCFQACLWMMESLKNFQILRKKKGGLWRRRWLLEMTIVQAEIGMMQSICDLLPMLSAYMAIKYFLLTYLIIMQLCKKTFD